MSQREYEVFVRKDLEDLIPTFLANRRKEIGLLTSALVASDFAQLRQLGHRMKGVGNSYGFALITTLGREIEHFANTSDATGLSACVARYNDFLSKVSVTYI
jgi:HPt (histidine-containing phosphotransfer) domain-containing protein